MTLNQRTEIAPTSRKDRVIGPATIIVIAILLIATSLSMWWAGSSERLAIRQNRATELKGVSLTLQEAVGPLLAHDDLAALRRLVVHVKDAFALNECRVTFPDGQIIADSDPSKDKIPALPARWAKGPLDAEPGAARDDAQVAQFPVMVAGRGTVIVYLLATVEYPALARSDMQGGLTLIGVAGVCAMLLCFRRMRSRVEVLGMIREAVLVSAGYGDHSQFLRLDEGYGAEAKSWNGLMERQEKLQREVTEKQTRELLGAESALSPELEAACNSLSDGLVLVGNNGVAHYMNGAAQAFLGGDREKLLQLPLAAQVKNGKLKDMILQFVGGIDRQRRQIEVEEKQGEAATILRYELRAVRCNGADELLITIHDCTQQRVADASRNSFVAHIIHELRTPLTTIGLYLEMASNEGEKDAATRAKCMNVITLESKRLERIVTEMLSVSEIEAGSMRINWDDVRLEPLFEGLKSESENPARSKNIQLTFEMPPKFPVIRADRDRVSLVLHNLLGNAIKYTPSGGSVKVAMREENGFIRIEVSDTGIGIEEKEQEQVFDRFYRSHDPRVNKIVGSGLGLTLAREIARLHGGDVTLTSQLNKGSMFTVTLPINGERR